MKAYHVDHTIPSLDKKDRILDRDDKIVQCDECGWNRCDAEGHRGDLLLADLSRPVSAQSIWPPRLEPASQIENRPCSCDVQEYVFTSRFGINIGDAKYFVRVGEMVFIIGVIMSAKIITKSYAIAECSNRRKIPPVIAARHVSVS